MAEWIMVAIVVVVQVGTIAYFQGKSNALGHATRTSLQRVEANVGEIREDVRNLAVDVAEMRGATGMTRTRAGGGGRHA